MAGNLQELQKKSSEKFGKTEMPLPQIYLCSDGTEIDDEDYFQTLEPNTELIAVFSGEQWIDVSLMSGTLSRNLIMFIQLYTFETKILDIKEFCSITLTEIMSYSDGDDYDDDDGVCVLWTLISAHFTQLFVFVTGK